MNPDDRKRRFNEAIVNMLYPSSSPQSERELEPAEPLIEESAADVISGALDHCDNNSSTSVEEEHDSETEKLSRAQRKKIRKKKLKEEVVHRGKLIGPLLPLTSTQVTRDAPPVRSNASEEGGVADCGGKSGKVKHRRMAKRLAKQKGNASTLDNTNQSSAEDLKEARL
ncbi:hypothetical protein LR48_Vigan06g024300 [Vigna angularis]|uniref:Uncharacterized protein n=2 Tax=Phaseolus angularis TaxID=3914 RepID=A0A0L9UQR7_PHAAN|nr:uncharacterized protein LOC108335535 [Vigna angularis]KAG2375899.1 uncharacterized protein HKW66_Vig0159470 [Vigna angularis]KOM44937.1 hypothetical protein LR48_Vigan06g024300 [Vigna angularis]BAU00307.1 hypothetical protein VIGAN_10189000 [Vigna angularis var. angularis]